MGIIQALAGVIPIPCGCGSMTLWGDLPDAVNPAPVLLFKWGRLVVTDDSLFLMLVLLGFWGTCWVCLKAARFYDEDGRPE